MPQPINLQPLANSIDHSANMVDYVDHLLSTLYPLAPTLKANPNRQAYAKLVAAIDEIVKTWQVTDEAFGSVWRLFNPKADLHDALDDLVAINDHTLRRQVENGRGHCHLIWDIYWYDLQPWFAAQLPADQQQTLAAFFERIGNVDEDVFRPMETVAAETEQVATEIIDLVLANQIDDARQIAKALLQTVRPLRQRINPSLAALERFQTHFRQLEPADAAPMIVYGDHITVGDIINSSGIAIGRGASARVTQLFSADEPTQVALYQSVAKLETLLANAALAAPDAAAEALKALSDLTKALVSDSAVQRQLDQLQTLISHSFNAQPAIMTELRQLTQLVRQITNKE